MASLLAAGVLAVGLSTGASAASAAPVQPGVGAVPAAIQVPTGEWVELWTPFITPTMHKCMDIPKSGVLYAQIYHCHGGPNQLWQFMPLGNGSYWIVNQYWGTCLNTYVNSLGTVTLGVGNCIADPRMYWEVISSAYDPDGFLLWNDQWNQCAGSDDPIPSGEGHQMLREWSCQNFSTFNSEVQKTTWRIG